MVHQFSYSATSESSSDTPQILVGESGREKLVLLWKSPFIRQKLSKGMRESTPLIRVFYRIQIIGGRRMEERGNSSFIKRLTSTVGLM